ncbi:hypothetical protein HYW31_02215 [Candidatus Berkelbacteria bacterium]|nr:hypothetical protein [Candidatus Berkelbacteria bacterium]
MDEWMTTLAFIQATTLLLSDYPTEKMDVIFFHGRAEGDDDNLFELAADLFRENKTKFIALNGSDGQRLGGVIPDESWPGKSYYTKRLKEQGIDCQRIIYSRPALHTREENDAFLELARTRDFQVAAILTQPHQILRVMLGIIQSMTDHDYWIRIYPINPKSTSWWKPVYGSQGKKQLPRFEHIEEEFQRVLLYQRSGTLTTFECLFNYLRRRGDMA